MRARITIEYSSPTGSQSPYVIGRGPSWHAWAKTIGPSLAACSLSKIPASVSRSRSASAVLRTRNGRSRRSSPSCSTRVFRRLSQPDGPRHTSPQTGGGRRTGAALSCSDTSDLTLLHHSHAAHSRRRGKLVRYECIQLSDAPGTSHQGLCFHGDCT
jgi:hypothetical protein